MRRLLHGSGLLLAAVLVVQLGLRGFDRNGEAAQPVVVPLSSERLRDANLIELGAGVEPPSSLRAVAGEGCTLLIFFASTCPYCEQIAPLWAEVDSVELGGAFAKVAWVGVTPADTGALDFVRTHRLAEPAYVAESRAESRRAGIGGWPYVLLVNSGVVRGVGLPWSPSRIRETEARCASL